MVLENLYFTFTYKPFKFSSFHFCQHSYTMKHYGFQVNIRVNNDFQISDHLLN